MTAAQLVQAIEVVFDYKIQGESRINAERVLEDYKKIDDSWQTSLGIALSDTRHSNEARFWCLQHLSSIIIQLSPEKIVHIGYCILESLQTLYPKTGHDVTTFNRCALLYGHVIIHTYVDHWKQCLSVLTSMISGLEFVPLTQTTPTLSPEWRSSNGNLEKLFHFLLSVLSILDEEWLGEAVCNQVQGGMFIRSGSGTGIECSVQQLTRIRRGLNETGDVKDIIDLICRYILQSSPPKEPSPLLALSMSLLPRLAAWGNVEYFSVWIHDLFAAPLIHKEYLAKFCSFITVIQRRKSRLCEKIRHYMELDLCTHMQRIVEAEGLNKEDIIAVTEMFYCCLSSFSTSLKAFQEDLTTALARELWMMLQTVSQSVFHLFKYPSYEAVTHSAHSLEIFYGITNRLKLSSVNSNLASFSDNQGESTSKEVKNYVEISVPLVLECCTTYLAYPSSYRHNMKLNTEVERTEDEEQYFTCRESVSNLVRRVTESDLLGSYKYLINLLGYVDCSTEISPRQLCSVYDIAVILMSKRPTRISSDETPSLKGVLSTLDNAIDVFIRKEPWKFSLDHQRANGSPDYNSEFAYVLLLSSLKFLAKIPMGAARCTGVVAIVRWIFESPVSGVNTLFHKQTLYILHRLISAGEITPVVQNSNLVSALPERLMLIDQSTDTSIQSLVYSIYGHVLRNSPDKVFQLLTPLLANFDAALSVDMDSVDLQSVQSLLVCTAEFSKSLLSPLRNPPRLKPGKNLEISSPPRMFATEMSKLFQYASQMAQILSIQIDNSTNTERRKLLVEIIFDGCISLLRNTISRCDSDVNSDSIQFFQLLVPIGVNSFHLFGTQKIHDALQYMDFLVRQSLIKNINANPACIRSSPAETRNFHAEMVNILLSGLFPWFFTQSKVFVPNASGQGCVLQSQPNFSPGGISRQELGNLSSSIFGSLTELFRLSPDENLGEDTVFGIFMTRQLDILEFTRQSLLLGNLSCTHHALIFLGCLLDVITRLKTRYTTEIQEVKIRNFVFICEVIFSLLPEICNSVFNTQEGIHNFQAQKNASRMISLLNSVIRESAEMNVRVADKLIAEVFSSLQKIRCEKAAEIVSFIDGTTDRTIDFKSWTH